jgi:hypothetical protein
MLKYTRWILIFTLLLMLALPALAQEATDEPAATAEPDQTVQVTVSSGGATTNEGSSVVMSSLQVVIGLIAAFGMGGVVGIAGAGTLAARLRSDATTVAALELLAKQVPPETAQQIMQLASDFGKSYKELELLVTEALDGIPAASKPKL